MRTAGQLFVSRANLVASSAELVVELDHHQLVLVLRQGVQVLVV